MTQGQGACCAPDNRLPHPQLTHAPRLALGFSPAEGPAVSGLARIAGPIPLTGPDVKKPLPLLPASLCVFRQLVTRQQKSLLAADAASSSPSLVELPGLRPLWLPPLLLPLPFSPLGTESESVSPESSAGAPLKNGREGEEGAGGARNRLFQESRNSQGNRMRIASGSQLTWERTESQEDTRGWELLLMEGKGF